MNKQNSVLVFIAAAFVALSSCNSPKTDSDTNQTVDSIATSVVDTTPINEVANYKFSYAIANVPSPLEILDEFAQSELPVYTNFLNPVENVDNYQSSLKQTFNYGIYGVDLGYLVVNNRTIDMLKYYSASKKLAEQLNMGETFNKFITRFESNADNKDSLKRVVDEAFSATDSYLRSNERLIIASQILAGSWLEAQHITVNTLKDVERTAANEKLFVRVFEQRFYLDNISKVLEEFKSDPALNTIKKDFDSLLAIYKEPKEAKDINKEFLTKLAASLDKVRANIIK
ncbi:MAG: hypothetical protein IPP29_23985 [Bacteroidetes bacterium]|nr:hypothetical protein [Bacteroidota bacterium]